MTTEQGIKYRKKQNMLLVSGTAIIALQSWQLIKNILKVLVNHQAAVQAAVQTAVQTAAEAVDAEIYTTAAINILSSFYVIVCVVYFLFNLLLGRAAINDALDRKRRKKNGKRKIPLYSAANVFLLVLAVVSLGTDVYLAFFSSVEYNVDTLIMIMLMDTINIFFYIQIQICSVRITSIRKKEGI